jgi:hypothetical protein
MPDELLPQVYDELRKPAVPPQGATRIPKPSTG